MAWPCNPDVKYIVHFPEERSIWSYGSGYGGNALLGKKCLALRIASSMAHDEGWLAEHMLIMGVTDPQGEKTYRRRRVPERVRQDQLRHARPAARVRRRGLEGHDGRRRHRLDQAGGRRQALRDQPRGRLLRRRAGHVLRHQPLGDGVDPRQHDLHQRRPHRRRRRLVGGHGRRSAGPRHRLAGQRLDARIGRPRPRTPTPASPLRPRRTPRSTRTGTTRRACPISAFIFGGRRSGTIPLVVQSFNWAFGVYMAATMGSETTAAAFGQQGVVRRDPFAMLPFAGYHIGSYINHWLSFGRNDPQPAAHLRGQLVPPGRRRQVRVAGLRREHARSCSGSSSARTGGPSASRARSAGCRATRTSTGRASRTSPRADFRACMSIDRSRVGGRAARGRGAVHEAAHPASRPR